MPSAETVRVLRAFMRSKVFQPGEFEWGCMRQRMHLLDLSRGGALVYAQVPPPIGSIMRFVEPACLGAARVVWLKGKRFGVAFAAPINQSMLDMVMEEQIRISDALMGRPTIV